MTVDETCLNKNCQKVMKRVFHDCPRLPHNTLHVKEIETGQPLNYFTTNG